MNKTGAFKPFLRASRTISSVDVTVTPFLRAFYINCKQLSLTSIGKLSTNSIGFLDCWAVCNWVRKWEAEFNDI